MLFTLLVTIAFVGVAKIVQYPDTVLKDEITELPGLPSGFTPKMFSGYININGGSRAIFYWFIESENNPTTDPVVMWTNGGPGCSGLDGLLTEMGPFKPTANTANGSLVMNEYRWNKIANMIFIEQPAGVGFSWTKDTLDYGDSLAASDNADFIEGWLASFSNFKSNDFYIASESYGGHYMPTLTKELYERGTVKTFKGMIVGNPLTWMPYRNFGQFAVAAGRNMYPMPEWEEYEKYKCEDNDSSYECYKLERLFDGYTDGTDPYALDFPVCTDESTRAGREQRYWMARAIHRANSRKRQKMGLKENFGAYFPDDYEPCIENYMYWYLQRSDVRKALHITADSSSTWEMCSGYINEAWNRTDFNAPMMPIYEYLVKNSGLKIMIYSGDDDSACATFGTQKFIWSMGWPIKSPWASWHVNGQVAGYVTKFEGFTFLTVHGAGHMVPATRPEFAYAVFNGYLNGTWF